MPIKEVLTSELLVYRPRNSLGHPATINYFPFNPVNNLRIYDEYISMIRGMATVKNPDAPGEFLIYLYLLTSTDNWPSWSTPLAVFNGKTGEFLGLEGGDGFMTNARNSGVSNFTVSSIFTAPDGSIWGNRNRQSLVRLNNTTGQFDVVLSLFSLGANIGTLWHSGSPVGVDPVTNTVITRLGTDAGDQLSVCLLSNGNFVRQINVCGTLRAIAIADKQVAYAVAYDGTLTAFNYLTGQVYGALHTGLNHSAFTYVAWSWDPFMRRLLYCPQVPDTLPNGDCNVRIHGYYPIALPVGMTPPIPLKYPQKGKTVPVFNRVYGGASEGIAGQVLTYSVGGAGATLSPARKATESNGTVSVNLTSTAAGANSVTSQTTV